MQFVLSILFCLFFQFFPRTIPVPSYSFCWQRWVVVVVVMENFSFEIIFFFVYFYFIFFLSEKKLYWKKTKKSKKKKFFHMHRSEYISADYKLFNFFLFSDLQVWFWELDNNNNILADCVHVCVCVWVTLGVNVDDDEIVLKSKRKFE